MNTQLVEQAAKALAEALMPKGLDWYGLTYETRSNLQRAVEDITRVALEAVKEEVRVSNG